MSFFCRLYSPGSTNFYSFRSWRGSQLSRSRDLFEIRRFVLQKGTDSAPGFISRRIPSGHLLLFAAMEKQHRTTSHSSQRVADDDGPLLGNMLGRRNATVYFYVLACFFESLLPVVKLSNYMCFLPSCLQSPLCHLLCR